MLSKKYKPGTTEEILGNQKQVFEIKKWIKKNKKGGALIITGPPGSGKTLSVELIAKELKYDLIKLGAGDFRNPENIKKLLLSSQQKSLMSKGKIIFIDELDSVSSSGFKAVHELIKQSPYPIVMIVDDIYSRKLVNIKKKCDIVKFYKIRQPSLMKFLKKIAEKEGIRTNDIILKKIVATSNGDVRAALNDLESLSVNPGEDNYRDVENKIFETINVILKTKNPENVRIALKNSNKTLDEIVWWLEENIKREYEKKEELAKAYDALSRIDVIQTRIMKRQAWSLQSYIPDLVIAIALSKNEKYKKFVNYSPPTFFLMYGKRKSKKLDALLEKMSKELHVSKKTAMNYLNLVAMLVKNKVIKIDKEDKHILFEATGQIK
ncbi:MAG: AAA family ATPase [Candidatus Aenigmarchaeota archaeon]|nr:AAA family ATPase [Candidatus Aenigmarchaeota archaeon]